MVKMDQGYSRSQTQPDQELFVHFNALNLKGLELQSCSKTQSSFRTFFFTLTVSKPDRHRPVNQSKRQTSPVLNCVVASGCCSHLSSTCIIIVALIYICGSRSSLFSHFTFQRIFSVNCFCNMSQSLKLNPACQRFSDPHGLDHKGNPGGCNEPRRRAQTDT